MATRRQAMRSSVTATPPLQVFTQTSSPSSNAPTQRGHRLDDARLWLMQEAAVFNREIGKIFRETGIALLPCPVLSLNPRGDLTLSNHHPDAERIRTVCRRNPVLRQRFMGLAETATQVHEADDLSDLPLLCHPPMRSRLVFQFAIGVDGPALFFTEGYLSWRSC